jgi:hypothetical protein
MTISAHENAILAHEMMIERRADMRGHKDDDPNWTACLKSVMHEHPNSIAVSWPTVGSNSRCQTVSRRNAM